MLYFFNSTLVSDFNYVQFWRQLIAERRQGFRDMENAILFVDDPRVYPPTFCDYKDHPASYAKFHDRWKANHQYHPENKDWPVAPQAIARDGQPKKKVLTLFQRMTVEQRMFWQTTWIRDPGTKRGPDRAQRVYRWIIQERQKAVVEFHQDVFDQPGMVTFRHILEQCRTESIRPFCTAAQLAACEYRWWDNLQPTAALLAADEQTEDRVSVEIRGQIKRTYNAHMKKMAKVRELLESELANNEAGPKKFRAMSADVSRMCDALLSVSTLLSILHYETNILFRLMPKSATCSVLSKPRVSTS